MRRASNRLLRLYDEALAPCGIKAFDYGVMAYLQPAASATLSEIAEIFFLDRAVLRYKLGPLEQAGLVAIEVDEEDRRARRLVLTPAGHRKVGEASPFWTAVQARFETAIGSEVAVALRETAEAVASSAFIDRFLAA